MRTTLKHYKVLGLLPSASYEQIKFAYRQLVFRFHPDQAPNDPLALERFLEVRTAWEALSAEYAHQAPSHSATTPAKRAKKSGVLPSVKLSVRLAETTASLLVFCGSIEIWPSSWSALHTEAETLRAKVQGELDALWNAFEFLGVAPDSSKAWSCDKIRFSAELSTEWLDELDGEPSNDGGTLAQKVLVFFLGTINAAFDWNENFIVRTSVDGRKASRGKAVEAVRPWFDHYGADWDPELRLVELPDDE